MSKRLIRIRPEDALSKLEGKSGIEVNLVLQNGRTYFGELQLVTKDSIKIHDTRNHVHHIALADLFEIVLDIVSLEKLVLSK